MTRLSLGVITLLSLMALGACSSAPGPATTSPSPSGGADDIRYTFLLAGNKAGSAVTRSLPSGEQAFDFEFNDRGRGPKTTTRVRLDAQGLPVRMETTGNDYWKSPVEELYERNGARATWKNKAESGTREIAGPAFYLSLNNTPQELGLLAKALLDAPGGRLPVLPAGEARIEKLVPARAGSTSVDLYSLSGLGFTPIYLWLDDRRDLFALIDGWSVAVREGGEAALPELTRLQEAADGQPVRDFLALLKERKTAWDPTIVTFEGMLTGRPGEIDPSMAAAADRLPPQVRRAFLAGGLNPGPDLAPRYRDAFAAMKRFVRTLYDAGVTLEAGTDAMAGFTLHRELELYAEAGIPAPDVLRIATLVPAQIYGLEKDLGTLSPGKLADLILVDGDPTTRIADLRRVVLTVKDGVLLDPARLYATIGVKPAV